MKMKIVMILLPLLMIVNSCSTLNIPHSGASQIQCTETWGDFDLWLSPGDIYIETDLKHDEIFKNANQSLNLLIERQNSGAEEDSGRLAQVVLKLSEYSFMKDYRLLNTMSLELLVLDERGNPLAKYYHSEESKDSFFAASFMYRRLKKGFKKLF